jgi:hypothetical protein
VIPAMGVVSAGAAIGLGAGELIDVLAAGAAGAAATAAIRALAGDAPASLIGAVLAPLLLITTLFDPELAHAGALARAGIAIAAAAWTLVELARPSTSPLVALLPATIAALLDPSHVALVPIAGARLMTAPWQRPRWASAVPAAGALLVLLAVFAHAARTGWLAELGTRWSGAPAAAVSPSAFALLAAAVLGPMTAVAALAGLPHFVRARHAEIAAASWVLGATLISARAGVIGPSLIAVAALAGGLAVGRFAGLIRFTAGQAILGVTVALLLLLPPAWTAIEHGRRVSIVHASR